MHPIYPLVTLIEFTAKLPSGEHKKTSFKLGLGPCGKKVHKLQLVHDKHFLKLHQWCTDGTRQDFIYKQDDVVGRVKVETLEYQVKQ